MFIAYDNISYLLTEAVSIPLGNSLRLDCVYINLHYAILQKANFIRLDVKQCMAAVNLPKIQNTIFIKCRSVACLSAVMLM